VLDLLVELDEAHAEPPREPAADGCLAGAAQAEQRDDAWGRSPRVMADEVGGRGLQRRGQISQSAHEMLPRPASTP
jgi:hypothetical protein